MNTLKNKIFFRVLVVASIMISSSWGCASKNVRTGSLKWKGNDYEKLLKKQIARTSVEAPTPDKFPKMTDEEYERLGDAYFRQGNLERAFVQYEKALDLSPNKPRVHYKKGLLFLTKGINEEAIEAFQEVLKKEPDHALSHEGIGHAHFKMNRFEDAKKHFQQALKGKPKLWRAHNFLGIMHDYQKRPTAAVDEYQAAIALKPNEGLLYNNLGVSYSLVEEYEKAVAAFKEALKTGASHRKIYNNLGLVLSVMGRYQEALEAFRQGGDEAQAYNNLGYIYLHQGEHHKAIRSFEKAIELAPTFYVKANENLKRAKTASLNESSFFSNRHTESNIARSSPAPVEQKFEPTLRLSNSSQKVVYVTASLVNIRTGASNKNKVITRVKRGDELEVLGETDSWYNVRVSNGVEGWIHKKVVK